MAERRMFSKKIIDSDAFLDMPLSTQSLYFHLSMRGDDEGFVNNPRKIQRMIGASEDDLKVLIAKNFIITFETGVVVIKHWKIHNYIRGDRLQPTAYTDERAMLDVKENGTYTLDGQVTDVCQSSDSIGKDSIGKDRKGKDRIDYKAIASKFNELCPSLSSVQVLSDNRKAKLKSLLNKYTLDDLYKAFEKAEASDFLKGNKGKGWKATFDWIIKPDNLVKVIEGNYDNNEKVSEPPKRKFNFEQREEDYSDEQIKEWLLRAAED